MYQAPDGRWFVTEQRGRIFVFANAPDARASVYLDLRDRVSTNGNEEGLLGFALAPDFASSGVFYVHYSAANPRRGVISRFQSNAQLTAGQPASEAVLLAVAQPFSNHNGGQVSFGPDGYLYIALGDGGSARDPRRNGQNLGTLLGSLLRIDVSAAAYAVPPDNPFVRQAGARAEIWAYGLRNPWRFSFDTRTGDLWLGDVGQNRREEVNLIRRGGNYGWNVMEGSECLGGGNACAMSGKTQPIVEYETGPNCSVTGGFVYRGEAMTALRGAYVFGDYCSGRIWTLRSDGASGGEPRQIARADFRISSFAVDDRGELYVLDHVGSGGGIYRIVQ